MEYFGLKRIIRNWNKKRSIYVYGNSLEETKVQFATEPPYTLKNFINYKNGKTSKFCVEIPADKHSTLKSLLKGAAAYMRSRKMMWTD